MRSHIPNEDASRDFILTTSAVFLCDVTLASNKYLHFVVSHKHGELVSRVVIMSNVSSLVRSKISLNLRDDVTSHDVTPAKTGWPCFDVPVPLTNTAGTVVSDVIHTAGLS